MLSGLFLSLHFAFWIGSLKYTSVASSVILVTTHPFFVGIGGWLLLGEELDGRLMVGILLALLGSGLISYGDLEISQDAVLGDGLALLGAIAAAGYLLMGRKLRRSHDLLSYILPVYATAGLVLILLALLFRKPFHGYSPSTYVLLFLLALVPQLIGHTTFNWALKYLPASMVSITILGEPVGSTILAYLTLGEGLTLWKVVGGLLIFSGILTALRRKVTLEEEHLKEE
jgi:drug/metabolite transporter (DMT)-like permease